jgi:hypothetical protein
MGGIYQISERRGGGVKGVTRYRKIIHIVIQKRSDQHKRTWHRGRFLKKQILSITFKTSTTDVRPSAHESIQLFKAWNFLVLAVLWTFFVLIRIHHPIEPIVPCHWFSFFILADAVEVTLEQNKNQPSHSLLVKFNKLSSLCLLYLKSYTILRSPKKVTLCAQFLSISQTVGIHLWNPNWPPQRHRWQTLSCEYLREFSKKFETALILYLGIETWKH